MSEYFRGICTWPAYCMEADTYGIMKSKKITKHLMNTYLILSYEYLPLNSFYKQHRYEQSQASMRVSCDFKLRLIT
jgi:hypothetical protein